MPDMTPEPASPRISRRGRTALAVVAVSAIAALVGLVVWAVAVSRKEPAPMVNAGIAQYEPAWSSAMAKAGVEATFPPSPVDVSEVRATGKQPFEATFTAEEISALMNVYRYEGEIQQQRFSLRRVKASFPSDGVGSLSGSLIAGNTSYFARIEGPVTYSPTGIDSPGATKLEVEGFTVSGERRTQASDAVIAYLNMYVRAAPGLIVERAEIVDDGLSVKGSAAQRLEHPAPAATP